MAPPRCPACNVLKLTELDSLDLRTRWAEEEGRKWTWTGGLAYWRLCLRCHTETWPGDPRSLRKRGSHCVDEAWNYRGQKHGRRGQVHSLVCGDLYLTQAPPESLRPAGRSVVAESSCQARALEAAPLPKPAHLAGRMLLRERHVGFVDSAETMAIPWLPVPERLPVPYGTEHCDSCQTALGRRCWGPPHVSIVELADEVGEVPFGSPPQRHVAILCSMCRAVLWSGGSVPLPSHDADWAAAYYTKKPSRRQVLAACAQPYWGDLKEQRA